MNQVVTIDTAVWGLLIAQILPIIVGLVTDRLASSGLKSVLLLGLTALTTVWDEVAAAGSFEVKVFVVKWALLFFASVASYYGWQRGTVKPVVDRTVPKGLK